MNEPTKISSDELSEFRSDTPSVSRRCHLDNAGASPMPTPVYEKILKYMKLERDLGGYAAMRECEGELQGLYDSLANLIGASRDEVAFAESATRAWDMAFYSIQFQKGDVILCGSAEYSSNYLAFLQARERFGVEVRIVPDNIDGTIDLEALEAMLCDKVRLVSVCHIPTSNGLITDAQAVGEVLRDHPALYFLDACQSVGQLFIDVEEIGCDVLTSTGRKYLRGPRGTGFLYVRKSVMEQLVPPFIDIRAAEWVKTDEYRLRSNARRFEGWESSHSCRIGFKAAIDYALEVGIDRIEERIKYLSDLLRKQLGQIEGITLWDKGQQKSGLVVFTVNGTNAYEMRDLLGAERVIVSALDNSDARLEFGDGEEVTRLRASLHYFNTDAEIENFVQTSKRLI